MEKLWTEKDLADFLQQSILTVRRNRTAAPHRHPPFIKIGASCRYDPVEVQRWLNTRTVNGLANEPEKTPAIKATNPDQDKRPGPGRPPKAKTGQKSKNAGSCLR